MKRDTFLKTLLEMPRLLVLNVMLSCISLWEYLRVIYRYYGNSVFRSSDLSLLRKYLWRNPYRIHKQFLRERGESDLYRYGETPLTTMALLAKKAAITPSDCYLELGCGRGRTCLWLHAFVGCDVVGIDYVPAFIQHADEVVGELGLDKIHFYCRDFLKEPWWDRSTIVYVDATLLDNDEIVQLLRRCEELPLGCRLLAVNLSPTGDYPEESPSWEEELRFTASYLWGKAEVSLSRRI